MKKFIMPELNDQNMKELQDSSKLVFARFKEQNIFPESNDQEIMDSAIVLAIFGVFNQDNVPISEKDICKIFSFYLDWLNERFTLN